MKTIIYGRYSTDKQDMSIEVQLSWCKEYAEIGNLRSWT